MKENITNFIIIIGIFLLVLYIQNYNTKKPQLDLYEKYKYPTLWASIAGLALITEFIQPFAYLQKHSTIQTFYTASIIEPNIEPIIKIQPIEDINNQDIYTNMPNF